MNIEIKTQNNSSMFIWSLKISQVLESKSASTANETSRCLENIFVWFIVTSQLLYHNVITKQIKNVSLT